LLSTWTQRADSRTPLRGPEGDIGRQDAPDPAATIEDYPRDDVSGADGGQRPGHCFEPPAALGLDDVKRLDRLTGRRGPWSDPPLERRPRRHRERRDPLAFEDQPVDVTAQEDGDVELAPVGRVGQPPEPIPRPDPARQPAVTLVREP